MKYFAVTLLLLSVMAIPVCAEIPRVEQGHDVYLNDTVDISGVVGYYISSDGSAFIQYCGGFGCDGYYNPYLLKLPLKTRVPGVPSQYRFYIDPAIFASRTGDWYQYDELDKAEHGNTLAFHVVAMYRNSTNLLENGTYVNTTEYLGNTTGMLTTQEIHYLSEKPVSDYIVARGDNLTIQTFEPSKVWIFGRNGQIYDRGTDTGNITIYSDETRNLEAGSYTAMLVYPGKNGEYDTRYSDGQIEWREGWSGIQKRPIIGIQPLLVVNQLCDIITRTDDTFIIAHVEVQDPIVSIEYFTEVPLYTNYSRYQEFKIEDGFVSMFDVRGYTNSVPGTNITVTLDETRHSPREMKSYTFYTTAIRNHYGNMSQYQVYVPIIWDKMSVGGSSAESLHTIIARNTLGASIAHDFPLSIMPADSFRPNATVKYVLDRNPWIPTPTPEVRTTVIEKRVVVERTIEIPMTPSPKSIEEAQWQVVTTLAFEVVGGIIVIGILYFGLRYLISVIKRARLK